MIKWLAGGDDGDESYEIWDRNMYVQIDKYGINGCTMFVPKQLIIDTAKALAESEQGSEGRVE